MCGALLSMAVLTVVTSGAAADTGSPPAGAFAGFAACMKEQRTSGSIPQTGWAGLQSAFAACRGKLPMRPGGDHAARPDHHRFALPTATQVAAFKACMAEKGFSRPTPGSGSRPDFRDPKVHDALEAALKTCLPQLKPASTG
jgi:hypothetical protein